jgi:hypothetical protein
LAKPCFNQPQLVTTGCDRMAKVNREK